jgi:DNA repair protein RadB
LLTVSEPVSTGCGALDSLLGGGFERGTVTQLYGPPAAGKTNVALSAAVGVATDGGKALYIDTEGLSVDRFQQLIEANSEEPVEHVASRLIITDAVDFDEQQEAVRDAAEFAEEVDLMVLDSATGFYRLQRGEDAEGGDSLRAVARQVTQLLSLARKHDIAVVITNQVYSDPDTDQTRPKPQARKRRSRLPIRDWSAATRPDSSRLTVVTAAISYYALYLYSDWSTVGSDGRSTVKCLLTPVTQFG